jgi:hypothetical protein
LLAEAAADARSGLTPEAEFRQGLDILLDGLASSMPPGAG